MDATQRLRGCLLGGAVGDALGAPIEFMSLAEIRSHYGADGPEGYVAGAWPPGSITDDTQMTLFTAEGLIRAGIRGSDRGVCHTASIVHHAYLRWLHTQGEPVRLFEEDPTRPDGWLVGQEFLHARRAPGTTCLGALRASSRTLGTPATNDSKGCGAVMRMAPVGVLVSRMGFQEAFREGCEIGALTHAHATGHVAAGYFAVLIGYLLAGRPLLVSARSARDLLRREPGHLETLAAVEAAVALAEEGGPTPEKVERLGQGWVAEEALSIGLYAALTARDVHSGLRLAVTHSGDSDSTGAIAGNLLGAMHGIAGLPRDLLTDLEGRDVILMVADDLARLVMDPESRITDEDRRRYPGW